MNMLFSQNSNPWKLHVSFRGVYEFPTSIKPPHNNARLVLHCDANQSIFDIIVNTARIQRKWTLECNYQFIPQIMDIDKCHIVWWLRHDLDIAVCILFITMNTQ